MEQQELIDALEPSKDLAPDGAQVRILLADGSVWNIVGVEYEPETDTVWLRSEPEE